MNADEIRAAIANPQRPKTELIGCRSCHHEWETELAYVEEPGGCGVFWKDHNCPKCGSIHLYVVSP